MAPKMELRRPAAAKVKPAAKAMKATKPKAEDKFATPAGRRPACASPNSSSPASRSTDVEIDGQIVAITQKDRNQFNAAKANAEPAVLENIRNKSELGYGQGKQLQLNKRIAALEAERVIKYSESMVAKQRKIGMGFVKAKQYFGGASALKEAIDSKECVVKKIDGREWYFDSSTLQLHVSGNIELDQLGLASMQKFLGDATAGFDRGADVEVSDDMMKRLEDDVSRGRGPARRNVDDDEAETEDFDSAVDRARNALKNLQGLRNKITELEGEANSGSTVRKSNIKKTIEKGKEIDELVKFYQDLVRTKALPGLRKTTAEDIRKRTTQDSKVGNTIVAMIRAVNELGD
ncbi:unnamed protein product [Prorocentrum cordatum]|uniref:Nascent polypeptide-associated complex subunit beta n=1 Tax=Prorocentrum cordatum TaxID=2364126 RepID=A0ABN9Y3T0_9DINO|nr:unnamed protein product [Polarella glacialis]